MAAFRSLLSRFFLLLLVCCSAAALAQKPFFLKDGDKVVFYGDSITAQRLYTTYIETAVHAYYPAWHIRFVNAGVGGDRVTGGVAGPIDTRLDRDVIPQKPTVVTVMLGMNDRATRATRAEYQPGYEHILERLHASLPLARIVIIGPSPYDDVTRPSAGSNGNQYLVKFLPVVQALARKYHAEYIDLNTPLTAALRRASTINHDAALMALPDQVHPEGGVHLLMAESILRAWHIPEVIAEVELDGNSGEIVKQQDTKVSALNKDGGGHLRWTEEDGPDFAIFDSNNGNEALYRMLSAESHIGKRMLRVVNLPKGQYQLRIDDKALPGAMTSESLAKGIDLSQASTPMRKQGRNVYYACGGSEFLQDARISMMSRATEISPSIPTEEALAFMDANLQLAQDQILKAAQPQRHTFSLEPIPAL